MTDRACFDATIGLGSNIGDKAANIAQAVALLTSEGDIRLVQSSRLYRTAPWGVVDQDWFINACISVATSLSPLELLRRCLGVEQEMKRVRDRRWGPRVIDVDVLTYGDLRLDGAELTLPHPRITERAFVLVPLAEVAPNLAIGGHTAMYWLGKIDASDVVPLGAPK
jgi:2-amino-4-hydroxy-6-hydroxymethyldihydropteridine diphosphokinase